MAETYQHTKDLHYQRTQLLCRLCGGRSKRKKDKYKPKTCLFFENDFAELYKLDVAAEASSNIFPHCFCNNCYRDFQRDKKNVASKKAGIHLKIPDKLKKTESLWIPFQVKTSAQDCAICLTLIDQSRGCVTKKVLQDVGQGDNIINQPSQSSPKQCPSRGPTHVKKRLFGTIMETGNQAHEDEVSSKLPSLQEPPRKVKIHTFYCVSKCIYNVCYLMMLFSLPLAVEISGKSIILTVRFKCFLHDTSSLNS